ncbi:MAG: S53 family peptidase, partial [Terriglobia bacterium]
VKAVQADETIHVTVVLRRRHADPFVAAVPAQRKCSSREEFGVIHGADPADLKAVDKFAHEHGLTVAGRHPGSRSVILSGTAEAIQNAFAVDLAVYEAKGAHYRGRTGSVTVPADLAPAIVAVLGLDDRPVAKPHSRRVKPHAAALSFTPPKLAELYNFPTGVTGTGQTIGIIELGGGYKAKDLSTYFEGLGLKKPNISAVSVANGQNRTGTDADGEVMLDIEVAGAVANGANIVVYFAPNTDQGFHDAIAAAVHDSVHQPSVISISWGGPENTWTQQALDAMNSALQDAASLGVTVTVAAGDDGATDGSQDGSLQVDFPSSSPYVLSCGGTKVAAESGSISSEQVWNELTNQEGA